MQVNRTHFRFDFPAFIKLGIHLLAGCLPFLGIAQELPSSQQQSIANTAITSVNSIQIEFAVNGKVTDATNGDPLPGVNVLVKGTTVGTVTNVDEDFTI